MSDQKDLYLQVILEHNKKPRNFRAIDNASHQAEGYNPLCGDHLWVYLHVDPSGRIEDISFTGEGCAISKASASMMTQFLKGKSVAEADSLFEEFHKLVIGKLDPDKTEHHLEKLAIFKNIWHFPMRVKCASLSWHTLKGALEKKNTISTE